MRNYFRNKVRSDYKLDNQKNSILLKEYSQVSIRREIEKSFTKIYDTKKHSYSNKLLPDNQNQSAYYNTLLNKNWYSDNLYLADSIYNSIITTSGRDGHPEHLLRRWKFSDT